MASEKYKKRLLPRLWVWIAVAFALTAVVVLLSLEQIDVALATVASMILILIAVMTPFVWFTFFSGYRLLVRSIPAIFAVVLIAGFFTFYRFDGFSGEMAPRFRSRFGKSLDRPKSEGASKLYGQPVDLATTTEHDFSQFLGPDRNASVDVVELARDWKTRPPRQVWRQPIGAGWSAFAAVGRFAVTMEQRGSWEMVTCYEIETGRLRWSQSHRARYQTVLGGVGPRATPTIHKGNVYTLGATGRLQCLNGADGEVLWHRDLLAELGVPKQEDARLMCYGRSNSPLIVDEMVIVPAGGPSGKRRFSLVAFDKNTGEPLWKGGDRQASYSSPTVAVIGSTRQILSVNEDNVSGHEPATGEVLWEFDWPGSSSTNANVSQAVAVGGDRVFLSNGYNNGAALLQVRHDPSDRWTVDQLWHKRSVMRTKFTNVAVFDGHVYGLSDGKLQCIELGTGARRWRQRGKYGYGQILRVGRLLLVQTELSGEIVLVEATEKGHRELGRFQTVDGKTWNNLCLSGPYLLVRNDREAACFELPLVGP